MITRSLMLILLAAVLGLGAHACLLPSESDTDLRVELTRVPTLLFPGDTFRLDAAVYDGAGNRVEGLEIGFLHCRLPGPANAFHPCQPSQSVDIEPTTGVGRAVQAGLAGIVAHVPGWPDAEWGADTVQVLAGVGAGIDSYGPFQVLFGDTVTIVGDVLNPDSLAVILVGNTIYKVSDVLYRFLPGQSGVKDTLIVWVVPPAVENGNIQIVRSNGLTAVLPIRIFQQDVLEPNSLTSPRILPSSFWNPGLALEASFPVDWYQVEIPNPSPVTVTVQADGVRPQLSVERVGTGSSLVVGSAEFQCLGRNWSTRTAVPGQDRFQVALSIDSAAELLIGIRDPTATSLVPYALAIEPAYISALPPDPAEGNDFCDEAYQLPMADTVLSLTLDNASDVDWFRLPVEGVRVITVSAVTNDDDVHPLVFLFADQAADSVPLASAASAQPLEQVLGAGAYLILVASPGGADAATGMQYELEVTSSPVEIPAIDVAEDSIAIPEGGDALASR